MFQLPQWLNSLKTLLSNSRMCVFQMICFLLPVYLARRSSFAVWNQVTCQELWLYLPPPGKHERRGVSDAPHPGQTLLLTVLSRLISATWTWERPVAFTFRPAATHHGLQNILLLLGSHSGRLHSSGGRNNKLLLNSYC